MAISRKVNLIGNQYGNLLVEKYIRNKKTDINIGYVNVNVVAIGNVAHRN